MRFELTAVDENAIGVVLPQELLAQIGLGIGDQVDVFLINHTLVLQPVEEADRTKRIEEITQRLLVQRKSVYEALAKGPQ